MMKFLVNPGDGHDVEELDNASKAYARRYHWRQRGTLPRIYALDTESHKFYEHVEGHSFETDRSQLPLKILAFDKRRSSTGRL